MANRTDHPFHHRGDGVPADREMIAEERLLAEVVKVNGRIPVGLQIGMPRHLQSAITQVDTLFVAHDLPHRQQLLDELTLWYKHAQGGLTFSQRCDQIMTNVIRHVGTAADRALAELPPF